MAADNRLKLGVIGAGARGETFARQLYAGTDDAKLFGICDLDADRLGKFCDHCELTEARRFTDPAEFFASPELAGVIITTPEFTHADVAIQAMTAGKHIYLEKPMAHTIADCERLLAAHRASSVTAYLGFNMRANPLHQKLKEVVASGVLGQLVHVDGLEQLSQAHSASFMRRFHRHSANTGGLLNHKCSHDLDILLWHVGHQHRVVKVVSFGGTNVFRPEKSPATHCHKCPREIFAACPYKTVPGFVFPVFSGKAIFHQNQQVYGGDLCVYNDDKDIVDNQTVMLEWEHGVRGSFNLQMFQARGGRRTRILGEKGVAELDTMELQHHGAQAGCVRVTMSDTGDTAEYRFAPREGGHGGSDPVMLSRFTRAILSGDAGDSGLAEGFAASLVALKADESRHRGQVVTL